jgi:integrase
MHLTKRYIDAAKYAGSDNSRDVRWDDAPKGFGLRIYPSGRKTFIVSYRNTHGVKRQLSIGDLGTWTLDRARKEARRLLVSVDAQADPLADRRQHRLEAKTGSVKALFIAYVEARSKDAHRKMKRPDAALWYAEKFIFPAFGSRPWRDVGRSEIRAWHASIKKTYNANRALQALRAAFYWRLWQEDDSPGNRRRESDTRNPCAGIELRTETRRQVRLELAELPRLQAAIDAETADPYLRTYFRFLLATGCRRSEALKLEWRDVSLAPETPKPDPNAAPSLVTFRDTKGGADHTVPLSVSAASLLRALPRLTKNPYVFVGHVHGEHLQAPGKAWQRIRKSAGLEHLRIHDMRRTFGSWLGDAGFTSKQIGSALGHKSDITSRVYMALGDQTKRAAVDAVETLMTNAGKPKSKRKGKVVPFPRRRA